MAREEDGSWIVGRADGGQFAEIPAEGMTFLRSLEQNESVETACSRVECEYGEEIDALDFIQEIADLGFIESVEGEPTGVRAQAPSLSWLAPRHVGWVFRWPTLLCVAAFIVTGGAVAIARGEPGPSYRAFFVTSSPSVNLAWNLTVIVMTAAVHEFWHLAAARAEGVHARIGLGTRLTFLVAQTTVPGLWLLPRRVRLRVYLAGIASDLLVLSAFYLALSQVPPESMIHRMLEASIIGIFAGLAYQFAIFTRTDIYFVLQELLKCKNLYSDAIHYMRYAMRVPLRLISGRYRPADPTLGLPERERKPVKIYSVLVFVGSAMFLTFFAGYEVPIAVTLMAEAAQHLSQGIVAASAENITDGALALVIQLTFIVTFLKLTAEKHGPKIRRIVRSAQVNS